MRIAVRTDQGIHMGHAPADLLRYITQHRKLLPHSAFSPWPCAIRPRASAITIALRFIISLPHQCAPTDQQPAARAKIAKQKQCAGGQHNMGRRKTNRPERVIPARRRARHSRRQQQNARQRAPSSARRPPGASLPYRHQRAEHLKPATRLSTSSARKAHAAAQAAAGDSPCSQALSNASQTRPR